MYDVFRDVVERVFADDTDHLHSLLEFLTRSDWGFLIGLSLLGNCNVFIHTLRFKCASKTHIHEQPNFPNVPSVERGCLHTCARTRDAPPDMTC